MVGSGAIMVMSEDDSMVKVYEVVTRFYAHESCGQCPQCREGTYFVAQLASRIAQGDGQPGDIDRILGTTPMMMGQTVCVLADSVGGPARSYLDKFRDEFDAAIKTRKAAVV